MVKAIESFDEWEDLIGGSQVVVLYYSLAGDGHNKLGLQVFSEFEEQFPQLKFAKVNVENQKEIAEKAVIMRPPIYIAYKDGQATKSFRGPSPDELEESLQSLL
ncbi:hypothetical protein L204_104035 [Cryptococcus depauperatus]|nr:hypothetical protein L204_03188 [Cryptococcus depauperatus CBS 7855]